MYANVAVRAFVRASEREYPTVNKVTTACESASDLDGFLVPRVTVMAATVLPFSFWLAVQYFVVLLVDKANNRTGEQLCLWWGAF